MNYPTFLRNIDVLTAGSDREKLCAFIHELARTIPVDGRESFITIFRNSPESIKEVSDNLPEEIDRILGNLVEIDKEVRRLDSDYSEEWKQGNHDNWYEEYLFSDPDGVLDDINEALSLIHKSIDREEYVKGYELALKLSEITIRVDGVFFDGVMMVKRLFSYELVDGNFDIFAHEALLLALIGSGDTPPARAVYTMMYRFDWFYPLQDILEMGEGKIDVPSFLRLWIETLSSGLSRHEDKYIVEAVKMLGDDNLALDYASKYASNHPGIYLSILRDGVNVSDAEMLKIGFKAMKEIEDPSSRQNASLYTAQYALKSGRRDIAENCWLEAFRAKPDVTSYLRIRLLCRDWSIYSDEIRAIYTAFHWSSEFIRFFDMDFDELMNYLVESKGVTRYPYRTNYVPLFLLLLSNDAGGQGMNIILKWVVDKVSFSTEKYILGTDLEDDRPDTVLFRECFDRWKRNVNLDNDTCREWMENIDRWVLRHVQLVMTENRRFSYESCAIYIAALGEVEESRGIMEKQQLMATYRAMYCRRYLFVDELVKYGFRK